MIIKENLHILTHPLIKHKLSIIRDKNTPHKLFREIMKEISMFLAYEATKDIELNECFIETPLNIKAKCEKLIDNKLVLVPILRAGLIMSEAIVDLIPVARVGHIGLYRDEVTHKPVEYYFKLPNDILNSYFIVCDPMLATGGSVIYAIEKLKEKNIKNIVFACIISCPEGVLNLQKAHPDVKIYTAALDEKLNEHDYIIPGLGDAGDRIYGTK
jgi:uracil phosphoribosyltransferase